MYPETWLLTSATRAHLSLALQELPREEIQYLASHMELRHFKAGEEIWTQVR